MEINCQTLKSSLTCFWMGLVQQAWRVCFHFLSGWTLYYGHFPFTKNFEKLPWKRPSSEERVPFDKSSIRLCSHHQHSRWWHRYRCEQHRTGDSSQKPVNHTCISIGKVSSGKTGLPFQFSSYSREFSSGTRDKSMFHLHPNKNFRNFLVNEKHPICFFW